MNSNPPKIFICFLPQFPETKCSDEIFDYMKPFILVAFPPLTLDHLLKTAKKETNKQYVSDSQPIFNLEKMKTPSGTKNTLKFK